MTSKWEVRNSIFSSYYFPCSLPQTSDPLSTQPLKCGFWKVPIWVIHTSLWRDSQWRAFYESACFFSFLPRGQENNFPLREFPTRSWKREACGSENRRVLTVPEATSLKALGCWYYGPSKLFFLQCPLCPHQRQNARLAALAVSPKVEFCVFYYASANLSEALSFILGLQLTFSISTC